MLRIWPAICSDEKFLIATRPPTQTAHGPAIAPFVGDTPPDVDACALGSLVHDECRCTRCYAAVHD